MTVSVGEEAERISAGLTASARRAESAVLGVADGQSGGRNSARSGVSESSSCTATRTDRATDYFPNKTIIFLKTKLKVNNEIFTKSREDSTLWGGVDLTNGQYDEAKDHL